MFLKRRWRDPVAGAVIDQADEGNALLRKFLFDEQVRRKVGVFVAHDGHDGHHSGVRGVVDGIDKVQHRLLPRSQRIESHEVFPWRVGEYEGVDGTGAGADGHIPVGPLQAELPGADAAERMPRSTIRDRSML